MGDLVWVSNFFPKPLEKEFFSPFQIKLVKCSVRNRAVYRNWPQITLPNQRFASTWRLLYKTCPEHRAQLSCILNLATFVKKLNFAQNKERNCPVAPKLASKHSAQLSFRSRLATFVKKIKPVQKTVRTFHFA